MGRTPGEFLPELRRRVRFFRGRLAAVRRTPELRQVCQFNLHEFWLCPETWGIDPLRHRFKILVNMSRLARSQVEKAFFRNAAGNVQRVWQRPAGGDAAKPSKPPRGKGGASWLRNQAALKHQETASMPSPVWTANRPNAESLKAYAACPTSPNTIRPLILNKGCLG